MICVARDVADVQEALRSERVLIPRGGGSKPGLSSAAGGIDGLDVSALRGVVEHLPQEFTLTARAATTITEARQLLASAGQYLPFDPMFGAAGATLGGTVAAGISGPGRVRYGGVRDFILGVKLIDGTGAEIRGGGKVVKNAAGFDLPKLMVGSLGTLGVLTEITFKVFPAPEATATVRVATGGVVEKAVSRMQEILRSPVEPEAIDIDEGARVWTRIAGRRSALSQRLERLQDVLPGAELVQDGEAAEFWNEASELSWTRAEDVVVRVPLTPRRIAGLDARLPESALRRFSAAGQVAWVAWPDDGSDALGEMLAELGLVGLRVRGGEGARLIGAPGPEAVVARVRHALDPHHRLMEVR